MKGVIINMAKVITYINEKGGIGKTTICLNISWELAKKGYKVLMIDIDGQKSNLTYFIGKADEAKKSLYDVLQNNIPPQDVILQVKENLYILPATLPITDLSPTIAPIKKVRAIIKQLRDDYDYIMIDVNPSPQWSHFLSMSVSDYVLIIMVPDAASVPAGYAIAETIEDVWENSNPNLKVLGVLFNMNDTNTVIGKEVRRVAQEYAEKINSKVLHTTIRRAVQLREYVTAHMGVTDYAPHAPVADDIRRLVEEVEREVNK